MTETEIKLAVESVVKTRRQLRSLGFETIDGRLLERNLLFDTSNLKLRQRGQFVRLRSYGKHWRVTWKSRSKADTRHKVREELEVQIGEGGTFAKILGHLGYRPTFEYQKYRTEFRRAGDKGKVMLDETPIGNFLEIEGSPRWIDRVARELGKGREDYILRSYGALYLGWCKDRRIRPSNMVFTGKNRLRLSAR